MKAGEELIHRYLEGHDKQFVIPVYQRNYDWKKEQCKQLFDDLLGIVKHNHKRYFLGSIVSIYDEDSSKDGEYVIIDGQQRITTLSILLLAVFNLLETKKIQSDIPNLKDQIKETYLVNKYSENDKRIRLKPIKDDNKAFLKLFDNAPDGYISNSNITSNYLYLEGRIVESINDGTTVDKIFDAVKRLLIVDIRLKRGEDNPQLIFESLNSTGKQLEESDLVRNFILMDKKPSLQQRFYDKFWHPIEVNTDFRVGDFIRDYLTYTSGKTPRKDKVYVAFKAFVIEKCEADETKLEELLTELLIFSKFYSHFLSFNTEITTINDALQRIARIQVSVVYPFLLDVFHAWKEEIIDKEAVAEILVCIESFAFRRLICNVPTNALNKVFATLGRNIRRDKNHLSKYCEIFKHLISAGTGSSRFPSDEEFRDDLKSRDIYNLKAKNRIHLFERLENYKNREKVDVERLLEATKEGLTFEHIMPQNLTSKWKDELGYEFANIHEKYLHTLGNLTLTAYNSELSNKTFSEKFNKDNGLKDSRLWLNRNFPNDLSWGKKEIEDRANLLTERAVEIWSFPQSSYQPVVKQDSQRNIYDDFNFTGTKPKGFVLLEENHLVGSWRELYQKTVKLLYELDSVTFERLSSETATKRFMSSNPEDLRETWKLADKLYLEKNLSTDGIIGILKSLFESLQIDETDFGVILREGAHSDVIE